MVGWVIPGPTPVLLSTSQHFSNKNAEADLTAEMGGKGCDWCLLCGVGAGDDMMLLLLLLLLLL